MKKDPKKVSILENGSYIEITYDQLCQSRNIDETYKDKHWFIRLHDILTEVNEADYKVFYILTFRRISFIISLIIISSPRKIIISDG